MGEIVVMDSEEKGLNVKGKLRWAYGILFLLAYPIRFLTL